MPNVEELDEKIAKEKIGTETLKVRNSDRLDFYDCGVGSIKAALIAMYELGKLEKNKENIKTNKKVLTK